MNFDMINQATPATIGFIKNKIHPPNIFGTINEKTRTIMSWIKVMFHLNHCEFSFIDNAMFGYVMESELIWKGMEQSRER